MAGDPHWASVVLALHMDDADASTVFTDKKGKVVTPYGNAKISTTQSKFGGSSAYFDGSGDAISSVASSDFEYGAGDFTLEMWIFPTVGAWTTGNFYLLGHASSARACIQYYQNIIRYYGTTSNTGSVLYTGGGAIPANEWSHVAVSRSSGTTRLFVNGILRAADTYSTTFAAQNISIGAADPVGAASFGGYIDDVRITKGIARYTANFTPPAAAFPDAMAFISGTVRDDSGALCARTVRAYRRSDGALSGSAVSDAVTGAYTIPTTYDDAHVVIVLDDDAGTQYNALVLDKVIPA